jgi:hypothetical protein
MGATILAAILWLSPQVGVSQARVYSEIIEQECRRWSVDPLIVVATIHLESRWNRKARSRTNDFGLLQLHVSATTHSGYLRKPERLFNPRTNLRLGIKMMALWKTYHAGRCRGMNHPWWSHYQHGKHVRNSASGRRVSRIYELLLSRFRSPGV